MTYLDLINAVLRRLRETVVTTASETDYSALVGELVNDAKKTVENSHEWTSQRSTVSFPTVVDQARYSLTGAKINSLVKRGMNDTTNKYLTQRNAIWYEEKTILATASTGSPSDFIIDGVDSDGLLRVSVYPTPNAIETLKFVCVIPQAALEADATQLLVPDNPVVQLAYAMALRERGETGGQSAAEQFIVAQGALADAIAMDASRQPGELDFFRL
jgi:hypothetical protein